MKSEGLDKAKALTLKSTEQDIFDAMLHIVEVTIDSEKYEIAWRKCGVLLQRQQHERMAALTETLTRGTWVLAIATWGLVLVPVLVAIIGRVF